MSRRVLAALAAATLMLGLAACGNEGEGPVTTPPPPVGNGPSDGGGSTQEPSDGGGEETEEPTVAAPDVPAPDPADYPGMDEQTPEGAEQAFRYYIAVVYWGYQTGETETLETLYQDACGQCEEIANEITDINETRAYWRNLSVTDAGILHYSSENFDYELGYGFDLSPHSRTSENAEITDVPETHYTAISGMRWQDDRWMVGNLDLRESENA